MRFDQTIMYPRAYDLDLDSFHRTLMDSLCLLRLFCKKEPVSKFQPEWRIEYVDSNHCGCQYRLELSLFTRYLDFPPLLGKIVSTVEI